MLNDINNFIKWLALKTFMINEVSNATKIKQERTLSKTRPNILLQKISLKNYR